MIKLDDKIRVVAAVVHQEALEVEIIFETTKNVGGSLNDEKFTLSSVWIDCEELFKRNEAEV
jgi:hypothetical protein